MARSTYIYIVTLPDSVRSNRGGPVVAAFTVKHECQSWLEDCTHPDRARFVVRRYADSPCYTHAVDCGMPVTFD